MHNVLKESPSTTKLRIVLDTSAKTSSGISFNQQLLPGPSLYPLLTSVINSFRCHFIAMTSDVSEMFREILLHPDEDYHRYLVRNSQGNIQDWRMLRLTFGVASSPFLAKRVLRQLAEDYKEDYPTASSIILSSFYVDDSLTGADTVQEAEDIRSQLCSLLQKAGMTLRKWRTNSQ